MATTVIAKTGVFTIADSDLGTGADSVTYKCTGAFAITLPATGVGVGSEFIIESTDGLQTFTTTGANVELPEHRELVPYPNGTGFSSSIGITCHATGAYKVDGDLNPTEWGEISFSATVDTELTTFTAGADVVVKWDTLNYNYGGGFNTTTDRFVAPQDGRYHFDATVLLDTPVSADTRYDIKFLIDGVAQHTIMDFSNVADFFAVSASADLEVSKDEYVQVVIRNRHATVDEEIYDSVSSQQFSLFTGHLVGGIKGDTGDFGSAVYQDEVSFTVAPGTGSVEQVIGTADTYEKVDEAFGSAAKVDKGGNWDATNKRFYAPVGGRYSFDAFLYINLMTAGDRAVMAIYKNGVVDTTLDGHYDSGTQCMLSGGAELELVAGDYVELWWINTSALAKIPATTTNTVAKFSGHLISPAVVLAPNGITHAFSVHKNNSDQSVTTTAPATTRLTWSHSRANENVSFDFTNNEFVAPSDGWYSLSAALQLPADATGNFIFTISANGLGWQGQREDAASYVSYTCAVNAVYMTAGSTAYVALYSASDSNYTIRGGTLLTWFMGHKVSGTSTGIEYDSYDVAFGVNPTIDQAQSTLDTWIPLEFDNIKMDNGGNFDDTNYKFIAPVDGIYQFNALVRIENFDINSTADFLQTRLTIENNGTITNATVAYRLDPITGEKYQSVPTSATYKLQAGATVGVDVYQHLDTTVDYQSTSTFSGHLVRATTKAECSFSAHRNGSDHTMTTNSGQDLLIFGTTDYNYGNGYDTTTGIFTAPEKGRYRVEGLVTANVMEVGKQLVMYVVDGVSGTILKRGGNHNSAAAVAMSTGLATTLDLDKNDSIKFTAFCSNTTLATIRGHSAETWVSVMRDTTTPTEVPEPYNPVVYEIEIATATDTIDVPAYLLSGLTECRLTLSGINDAGAQSAYYLYVNGDNTGANYIRQSLAASGGTPLATDDTGDARINAPTAGETCLSIVQMSIIGTNYMATATENRDSSGDLFIYQHIYQNTTTDFGASITGIQLKAAETTGFGVGTRLKILRD